MRSTVAFAEFNTPGKPAPGWVPAPTRYKPGMPESLLEGLKYALCVNFGATEKAEPLNAASSVSNVLGVM